MDQARTWEEFRNACSYSRIPAENMIWADRDTTDKGLHANFRLNAGGEEIGLFDTDGSTLIDSVIFLEQTTDISYGRYPDGTGLHRGGDGAAAHQPRVEALPPTPRAT